MTGITGHKQGQKNKYRMVYYLPHQPREFSGPQVFETENMGELQDAIAKARKDGHEIISVEMV